MTFFVHSVDADALGDQDLAKIETATLNRVVECIVAQRVILKAVDTPLLELVVDSPQNVHQATSRIFSQNVHQVLIEVVLALDHLVVRSLGEQSEN